jgi:NADH dehydrogenase (ubiquinone) Fe-S protein 5
MSSGFGTNGGRGRCFEFWQDLAKCHVSASDKSSCLNYYKDYQECLYHKKEVSLLIQIQALKIKSKQ